MNRPKRDASRIPRASVAGMFVRAGAYRLPDDVARRLRSGHPWVFREALAGRTISEPTGAVVDLMAGNGAFVARGYVDRDHSVAVRVLSRDPAEPVHPGAGIVARRFQRAVQLRWLLLGAEKPTALRLFAGESEGLPGVTVDRYADFVVVQWYSAGALPWREELLDAITEAIHPRGIYEQKRLRPLAGQAPADPASARAR